MHKENINCMKSIQLLYAINAACELVKDHSIYSAKPVKSS